MKRLMIIAVLLATAAAPLLASSLLGRENARADDPPQLQLVSNYSVQQAQTFNRYPIYYAGSNLAGLPLTSVNKEAITAPAETTIGTKLAQSSSVDNSTVEFTYGTCVIPSTVDSDECSIPVVVQMWPACIRNPALYQDTQNGMGPTPVAATVRGVPAAYFEDGVRLEIQTGTATIVIFDHRTPAGTLDVANALERLNGPGTPVSGQNFPQPSASAMDGSLPC